MILEVLDRRGRVRERRVIGAFPAWLGRAYDCAVILDDPYVSPHHARVVRADDGSLVVEDHASRNGTFADDVALSTTPWRVVDDGIVRLGQTRLRFRSPEHQVAPALVLPASGPSMPRGRVWLLAVTAILVALLHALREAIADSPEPLQTAELATSLIGVAGFLGVWGGAWALGTRLVQPRFAFIEHAGIAAAAIVGFDMVVSCVDSIAFAWAAALLPELLSWVLFFVAFAATLYAHLRVSWQAPRRRVGRTAVLFSALLFAAVSVPYWTNEGVRETWQIEHMFQLAPSWMRMKEPIDVNTFVDRFDVVRARIDAVEASAAATPTAGP